MRFGESKGTRGWPGERMAEPIILKTLVSPMRQYCLSVPVASLASKLNN